MLESLLANTDSAQPWLAFVRNIVFGALLAMLLEQVYTRYGHSLSNRSAFARHFYLLTMTTTLIITVVQSSLALSLGLIGALSIVRFRAAIKEPEELVYIFLAVAIGLGLGANQLILTLTAVATIVGVVWLRHLIWDFRFARPGWPLYTPKGSAAHETLVRHSIVPLQRPSA